MKKKITIDFDESTHTYKVANRPVPHVTGILKDIFGTEPWYKEWYANRGKAIHYAIHLMVNNNLDWNSLDKRIEPRIVAFERFLKDSKYQVLYSEIMLYHKAWNFAGTIDLILYDPINKKLILADIKSSFEPKSYLQNGGYSILHDYNFKKKIWKSCIVELKDDGMYDLKWVPDLKEAERVFLSCLMLYNWTKKYHNLKDIKGQLVDEIFKGINNNQ